TGNPVLATNVVIFSSFVLCGLAMFALARSWTGSFPASFTAGMIYAFAPLRFGQLGKLQLLGAQGAPLALLFPERVLRSGRARDGLLASGCYVLQVLTSYYLGYGVTVVIACYLGYRLATEPALRTPRLLVRLGLFALLALVVILPCSYPYLVLKRESGLL